MGELVGSRAIILLRNYPSFLRKSRWFVSRGSGAPYLVTTYSFCFSEIPNFNFLPSHILKRITNFYRILSERMEGKRRLSGEPEINHPVRIFNMMVGDGIRDFALLSAALGHDAIEDGYMNFEEIVGFVGEESARLIEGETKLSRAIEPNRREVESLVKWIEAAFYDPRIVLLKAYDNFDNWRDKEVFLKVPGKEHKPREHAEETIQVYGPILRSLGFWELWVKLEDQALKYYDQNYGENFRLYQEAVNNSFAEIETISQRIQKKLAEVGIHVRVSHRIRHYSEIYDRAKKKNLSVKGLLKSRPLYPHYLSVVIDGGIPQCHYARGVVDEYGKEAGLFQPETWGLNNLVQPRENGYRALHTYVSLPGKGAIMIGYTTSDFDQQNRLGILAQGKKERFKNGWARANPLALQRLFEEIREKGLLTAKQIRDRIPEVISAIKVYNPEGESLLLQANASVLDYALLTKHLKVKGIYVNGKRVESFSSPLKEGDIVEIKEGEKVVLTPLSLLVVKTHEAAKIIREYLRSLPIKEQIILGIEALDEILLDTNLKWTDVRESSQVARVLESFSKREVLGSILKREGLGEWSLDNFVILVGRGEVDVEEFKNEFLKAFSSSLKERKEKGLSFTFAVLFKIAHDRVGLQQEFSSALKSINMNIMQDQTKVNLDGTATLAYVFELYSSLQQRQIENIISKMGGEILGRRVDKTAKAVDFPLAEWLRKVRRKKEKI